MDRCKKEKDCNHTVRRHFSSPIADAFDLSVEGWVSRGKKGGRRPLPGKPREQTHRGSRCRQEDKMRWRRWAESRGPGVRSLNLPAVKTIDKLSQGKTQKDLYLRIVTLTEGGYLEEDCSLGDQLGVDYTCQSERWWCYYLKRRTHRGECCVWSLVFRMFADHLRVYMCNRYMNMGL